MKSLFLTTFLVGVSVLGQVSKLQANDEVTDEKAQPAHSASQSRDAKNAASEVDRSSHQGRAEYDVHGRGASNSDCGLSFGGSSGGTDF